MKTHFLFGLLSQIIILLISFNFYFEPVDIKLFFSLLLIIIIYVPAIFEFITNIKLKKVVHYLFTITCLLLFIILIVF